MSKNLADPLHPVYADGKGAVAGGSGGGVTLLLDNHSLKGFGKRRKFYMYCGGLWMVAGNS